MSFEERKRQRANWPIHKYQLGKEPVDNINYLPVSDRIISTYQLSLRIWNLSGQPIEKYSRDKMPGRLIRVDEQ